MGAPLPPRIGIASGGFLFVCFLPFPGCVDSCPSASPRLPISVGFRLCGAPPPPPIPFPPPWAGLGSTEGYLVAEGWDLLGLAMPLMPLHRAFSRRGCA